MLSPSPTNKLNTILFYSVFILVYLFLLSFLSVSSLSNDSFWHIQMGIDTLSGLAPNIDHHSFTHNGLSISSVAILFQVSLAFFVNIFGLQLGSTIYVFLVISLLTLALLIYCKKINASWIVLIIILPTLLYYFTTRLLLRPELLSYVLIITSLNLSVHSHKHFNIRSIILISLLLLFWVNWHVPVFGYIIFFGLFLDKLIAKLFYNDNSFSWNFYFLSGLALFFIGFINQNGEHFLYAILNMNNEWKIYIEEFKPAIEQTNKDPQLYILWLFAFYLAIWCLFKKKFGFAFITILLAIVSWQTTRLIAPAGIIISCLTLFAFSQSSDMTEKYCHRSSCRILLYACLIFLTSSSILYFYSQFTSNINIMLKKATPYSFAEESTIYLNKTYPQGGKIFNEYGIGGYLLYKLNSNFQIYIDGRSNILYPLPFYKRYLSAKTSSQLLNEEILKYDIDFAVSSINPKAFFFYENTGNLHLEFIGENYFVFTRETSKFPYLSKLGLFPMCWDQKYVSNVQQEVINNSNIGIEQFETMNGIYKLATGYANSKNKTQYLNTLNLNNKNSDIVRRLAAYIAYKSEDYENVSKFIYSFINHNNLKKMDMILVADSAIQLKKYPSAEKLLNYILSKETTIQKSKFVSSFEKVVLLTLYKKIRFHKALDKESLKNFNFLDKELQNSNSNSKIKLAQGSILPNNSCEKLFDYH